MKSIFPKLILSFLAIILIVILTIGLLFSSFIRNNLIKQKESELKNKGTQIIDLSRRFLNGEIDDSTFSYVLDSIDEAVNTRTIIIDNSGIIINTPLLYRGYWAVYPKKGMQLNNEDIVQLLNGSTVVKNGYSPFFSEPMIIVGFPVYNYNNSKIIGAILLNSPVTGVTEGIGQTIIILLLASLGAFVFALFASYFLSKTLSKPIHLISKAALEIAEGDYSRKVNIKRKDEIGSLASAFNYLTEKLNSTIGDLNREKRTLTDIIFSMEEGLIAADTNLNIIHINPAALKLFSHIPAGTRTTLSDLSNARDIIPNVMEVLKTGRTKSYETSILNRYVNVLISPLKFQNGRVYGVIILLQDISESMKLEKMRRDFVANVSHELRTPLTSIRGFIEPLIDGTVTDGETRDKYNSIIRSETLRLERLINDLLDLSRLQSGKIILDIQKVNIIELISNISNKFQPQFDSKNIKYSFYKPSSNIAILADGDRIEQLMVIFIDNAIKYTNFGGKIDINVAEEESLVRISIKDTGIGIPEEDIPYIWERFYKVDKSRTGRNSGTGLGLSIAKNIVELHGQKVTVKSKIGEGSVFEFTMKKAI